MFALCSLYIYPLLRTCATDIFAFTSSRYKFVLELESCMLRISIEVCPIEILSIRLANRRIGRRRQESQIIVRYPIPYVFT